MSHIHKNTGELWLSVLLQVECTSVKMICVRKSMGEMRKTAVFENSQKKQKKQ